jgi:hypothetical protein
MTVLFVLVVSVLILTGVALGYGRLASAPREAFDDGSSLEFDSRRYAVLTRLASPGDLRVVRGWNGSNKHLERRIAQSRFRAASGYLHEMRADFRRLETAGRMMVLAGGTSLEFRQNLVDAKFRFTWLWWRVRVQFLLLRLGFGGFNAEGLIEVFDRFVATTSPLHIMPAEA